MGFQDVAFLPSRVSFSTIFLKNCGRGECLWTTACLKTVSGGKQGHAPCKILLLQQSPYFVSDEFHSDHKIVNKFLVNLATLSFIYISEFKTMVSLCLYMDVIVIT